MKEHLNKRIRFQIKNTIGVGVVEFVAPDGVARVKLDEDFLSFKEGRYIYVFPEELVRVHMDKPTIGSTVYFRLEEKHDVVGSGKVVPPIHGAREEVVEVELGMDVHMHKKGDRILVLVDELTDKDGN